LAPLIVAGVILSSVWWYVKGAIPGYLAWIVWCLFWILYSLLAVSCHRIVLLGRASVPEHGLTRVGGRELRFALGLFKVGIIAILTGTVLLNAISKLPGLDFDSGNIEGYLEWIMYFVQIYVFARFGLILPAIAIDGKPTLKWAWRISRGNTLRLMLVLGLLPLLVQLPLYLFPENPGIPENVVYFLVWWMMLPFEITALSLSYKELINEWPEQTTL
jgi:hypothetical protein